MTKNITIQTITPTYDQVEDRIRISFNYQDIKNRIDMMLTRAFLLQMLPSFEEYIYKHYPEENIEDELQIQMNSIEKKVNGTEELSQTSMEDLSLYHGIEDLLFTINLSFDNNSKFTTLHFISKQKYRASLSVNVKMLKNILFSIKNAIPSVNWGISGYI